MENSKKKNGEYKESVKIIGHSLKSSLKKHKVLWGFGIAIAVLIIIVSVFSAVVSSQNFSARMIDMLMPSYLPVTEYTRVKIEFHREINEEYLNSDSKIEDDNYIEMFNYYYIDENGEKRYLDDGIYYYTDDDGNQQKSLVSVGFLYSMGQRVTHLKEILKIVALVLVAVLIVLLIIVWYVKDKKRNEQNKPKRIRKAENKNQ